MGTKSSIIFDGKTCFRVIHKQFMNELYLIYRSAYSLTQGLREEKKKNKNGNPTISLNIIPYFASSIFCYFRLLSGNLNRRKKNGRKERKNKRLNKPPESCIPTNKEGT